MCPRFASRAEFAAAPGFGLTGDRRKLPGSNDPECPGDGLIRRPAVERRTIHRGDILVGNPNGTRPFRRKNADPGTTPVPNDEVGMAWQREPTDPDFGVPVAANRAWDAIVLRVGLPPKPERGAKAGAGKTRRN